MLNKVPEDSFPAYAVASKLLGIHISGLPYPWIINTALKYTERQHSQLGVGDIEYVGGQVAAVAGQLGS